MIDDLKILASYMKVNRFTVFITSSILVLLLVLNDSYYVVNSGEIGVVTHFGSVQDQILPEGLHLLMPVKTEVIPISVRVQKIEAEASASSKDLQMVRTRVALNFYLSKKRQM